MSIGFSTVNGVSSGGAAFGLYLDEGSESIALLGASPASGGAGGGGKLELNLNLNSVYKHSDDASSGLGGTYQLAIREVEYCDKDGNTKYMLALCSQPYNNSIINS